MNIIKRTLANQEGYALLTVLLVMVIFTGLAITFMGQGMSTAKQNKQVEHRTQAVDLAEMGTQYYANFIKEEFETISVEIQKDIDLYLKSEELKKQPQDQWEGLLKQRAVVKAKEILSNYAFTNVNKNVENESTRTLNFRIENPRFSGNAITFDAIGSVNGEKEVKISSILNIDFDQLRVVVNGGLTNWVDMLAPDEKFNSCPASQTNFFKEKCKYDGKTFENNAKPDIYSSEFKIKGNLTLPNINNSNLANSVFYITGDFYSNKNVNKISNATFFIGGIADFGNLNNATNVKICVNELKSLGNMNKKSDVKIYARVNKSGDSSVITDENAFKKACLGGVSDSANGNVLWEKPVKEEYNYNY